MLVKSGCLDQWYTDHTGTMLAREEFLNDYPNGLVLSECDQITVSGKVQVLTIQPHGNEFRVSRLFYQQLS